MDFLIWVGILALIGLIGRLLSGESEWRAELAIIPFYPILVLGYLIAFSAAAIAFVATGAVIVWFIMELLTW